MAQDAITLLDTDHERVEALFRDYQSSGNDQTRKKDLAQVICLELTLHTALEEEIFYPAFEKATGDKGLVQESNREHQEAKDLIAKIRQSADAPDALMQELQRAVEHHVQDERQKMFPKARSASGLDLAELGRKIEARKPELTSQMQPA